MQTHAAHVQKACRGLHERNRNDDYMYTAIAKDVSNNPTHPKII